MLRNPVKFEPPRDPDSNNRDVLSYDGVAAPKLESMELDGHSVALGAGTLELVEEDDMSAARLHVPGCLPLDLFSEQAVRAFRLLVDAARRGAPGVRSGDLISGTGSSGFQQMIGSRRWPLVRTYVESVDSRRWKLKNF